MDIADVALNLPGTAVEEPFEPGVPVFKVDGKVFAVLQPGHQVTLKCDPEQALSLRDRYPSVTPGYHMNKKHWNTVQLDGSVPDDELAELIEHAWDQVVAGLPKRRREQLELLRADR